MAYRGAFKQYLTFNLLNLTSGLASEVKMALNGEEIDMTVIGSNWKEFDQGQADATLTVSGVWDNGTATTSLDNVAFANMNAGGTKLYEYMPAGSASGAILYKGNGFITAYEVGGAVGDKVGFSATIRNAGSPQRSISA